MNVEFEVQSFVDVFVEHGKLYVSAYRLSPHNPTCSRDARLTQAHFPKTCFFSVLSFRCFMDLRKNLSDARLLCWPQSILLNWSP